MDLKTQIKAAKELYKALDDVIYPYEYVGPGKPMVEDFSRMKGSFVNDSGEDCGTIDFMVDIADINRAIGVLEKYRYLKKHK